MRCHSVLTTGADLEATCRQAAAAIRHGLGPGPIDLLVVFASPRYGANIDRLPVLLHDLLGPRLLIGCSGGAMLAPGHSSGHRPAVSVLAGRLPDTRLDAALVCNGDLPDADGPPGPWRALLPEAAAPPRGLLVLCNPFHCDVPALLAGLDYGFPGMPKVGGIASGSRHPDGTALFFGRSTHRHGAIVVGLGGNVRLDAVVCQGSRPIGKAGRVTKAESNRLVAVDDKPVRDYVEEQLATLPWLDIERATDSLLLGISHDSFASDPPAPGEYLVRNILGMAQGGELVVAERLAIGRHVQLHLRDEAATAADLRALLQRAEPQHAAAGLLFRCLGREGTDHTTFDAVAPGVPLAGFDCGGEIGTVGATTALHTYTAAFALLRPHSAPASERNERP